MPDRLAIPKPTKVSVFRRDGWICCWCRRPVIFAPVAKFLALEVREAGLSAAAYYHPNWTRQGAPLLDELGAVVDHIKAHSAKGPDDTDNLATACNKCNGRKSSAEIAIWEARPKTRPVKGKYGEPQEWDGLSQTFVVLANKHRSVLTGSEREWLRALS
jgi:5-methylcytosine-specific restriction endonuclease McrA